MSSQVSESRVVSPSASTLVSTSLHGVLLLDKPLGMSSNQALGKAKHLLRTRKAGHTGTLDPLASGLLPLCFGEATKFSADLLDADKTYETTVQLGVQTTTGDAEGAVVGTVAQVSTLPSLAEIEVVLARFRGPIQQVPPMHSALKHEGKALYEYARAGVDIPRAARAVTIHQLDCLGYEALTGSLHLRVCCSKGTYIRTLGEDIGRELGCGGHLTHLRRIAVGNLAVSQAMTLEELYSLTTQSTDKSSWQRLIQPVDTLLQSLPRIVLPTGLAQRFQHGQRLALRAEADLVVALAPIFAALPEAGGLVRVYDPSGLLLGTAELAHSGRLQPQRLVSLST